MKIEGESYGVSPILVLGQEVNQLTKIILKIFPISTLNISNVNITPTSKNIPIIITVRIYKNVLGIMIDCVLKIQCR